MAPLWTQLGASILAIIGCSSVANAAAAFVDGKVDFVDPSSRVQAQTWYRIYGDLKTSKRPPLVVLHGGPGIPSDYLWPLSTLTEKYGVPVVVYDQIGNGRSTHLRDRSGDTKFWTEELFRNELDNLLSKLGINEKQYDILGHSWGGMLGSAFATYKPKNLRRLVIYSSPASMDDWIKSANRLRAELPQDVQNILTREEKAGRVTSKEYLAATNVYYERHLCRVLPFPTELQMSLKWIEEDPTVYMTMVGPSEFFITGNLKTWSIVDRLPLIKTPTLVMNGQFDTAQDFVVAPFVQGIDNSVWVKMRKSSHMAHFEEPQRFLNEVAKFLYRRDSPRRNAGWTDGRGRLQATTDRNAQDVQRKDRLTDRPTSPRTRYSSDYTMRNRDLAARPQTDFGGPSLD